MDDKGRLHMPGFVGKTFEETGVVKEIDDEATRIKKSALEAELRAQLHDGMNRKQRRKAAKLDRERIG